MKQSRISCQTAEVEMVSIATFVRNWTFYSVQWVGREPLHRNVIEGTQSTKLPNTYRHTAIDCWKRGLWRSGIELRRGLWLIHQMIHQFLPYFWTPSCPSPLLVPAASWFPSHCGSLQDLVWDAWHGQTWKPHENLCMMKKHVCIALTWKLDNLAVASC